MHKRSKNIYTFQRSGEKFSNYHYCREIFIPLMNLLFLKPLWQSSTGRGQAEKVKLLYFCCFNSRRKSICQKFLIPYRLTFHSCFNPFHSCGREGEVWAALLIPNVCFHLAAQARLLFFLELPLPHRSAVSGAGFKWLSVVPSNSLKPARCQSLHASLGTAELLPQSPSPSSV